ncbi:MAG TPA: response regulator transcription factor [Candidatus Binataceae bacterium]|nr:response regulator transcription factor [Candidatus Binataceae bacterium]
MNSSDRIRVLLVDDHSLFLQALRAVLESKSECVVVGEANTTELALGLVGKLKPHVVLLDVRIGNSSALPAIPQLKAASPSSRILIVTSYDEEEYLLQAFSGGEVSGYVLKDDDAQDLINAIRTVHAGRTYISSRVSATVLRLKAAPNSATASKRLTSRESQVLRLLSTGATSKDIAQKLGISPKTAQVHRENLKHKLELHSTAELVRYAIKHKLLRID